MIIRLWPLTLLVTQIALGFDHSIDLERCNTDTTCFVRQSCLESKSDPSITGFSDWQKTLVLRKNEPLKDGECDVVLEMKVLSDKLFHVMMRVIAKSGEKLKKEEGLKLDQQITQFHCKPGVDKPTGRNGLTLENAGAQLFNDTHIFCSFTVALSGTESVGVMNNDVAANPKIVIVKDNGQEDLQFIGKKKAMWIAMASVPATCEPTLVKSSNKDGPNPGTLLLEMNTFANPPFNCINGGMSVEKADGTLVKAKEVSCASTVDDWKWHIEDEVGDKSPLDGEFSIYCTEQLCQKCNAAPTPLSTPCSTCTNVVFTTSTAADVCPALKCNGNEKWTVDGKTPIDGPAECKKIGSSDPPEYSWHVKNEVLKTAACLKKIECGPKFATEKYPKVSDACKNPKADECKVTGLGTEEIKCKDGFKLSLNENNVNTAASVQCDSVTGQYKIRGNATFVVTAVDCISVDSGSTDTAPSTGGGGIGVPIAIGLVIAAVSIAAIIGAYLFLSNKKKKKAPPTSKTTNSTKTKTLTPGDPVDGSDKKSSKKEKKFKLEDYETWTNEQFQKIILPNFKTCAPDSKTKWVRNCMGRFYGYCNTKKAPESGTFNQFWLLVKQCADDKCEDGGVWREMFRIAFTMQYTPKEKNTYTDDFRLLVIKPFEAYMVEYLKKCDFYKRKDEPRAETEMRVICLEILLHTRHPDVTEKLRTLTYNEKLEVPLRMLTAACYTRERDDKPATVQIQYKRVLDTFVLDPHIAEGWGTFLQHCLFGLSGYLITHTEKYQYFLFEALYQFPDQKSVDAKRLFSPSDWLFAYKGALLHENSAKLAHEMFIKYNEGCLLHIEALLKQRHKEEEVEEREKTREQYRRDMKEFTLALADLLVGEEEFNEFKSNLRFVILFLGEMAKKGEELSEERVRERAINMGNMIKDRDFAKQSNEALKAIGAKITA